MPPSPARPARRRAGHLAAVFTLAAGCVEHPPPTLAPSPELLDCAGFPFAPPDSVARCAASEVVEGVAVEKAWRDHAVEFTVLIEEDGVWRRWPLGRHACGGEVPAGCSHDELFRRRFDIARDGDRVALYAAPVYSVDTKAIDANTEARALMRVEGAPPYVWFVRPDPASARALLASMPETLAGAYALTLSRGGAVDHANAAFDAGVTGPREALTALIVPPADCDDRASLPPLGKTLDERFEDPWTLDVLGAAHAPCMQRPDGTDTLRLPAACLEALATCSVALDAALPVSVWAGRRVAPSMLVPSTEPAPYLAPDFHISAPIYAGGPVFAATRQTNTMEAIHSRGPVVWLGPDEVRVQQIQAPLSVAPASPAGSTWQYPEGTRWCFIPPEACPAPDPG